MKNVVLIFVFVNFLMISKHIYAENYVVDSIIYKSNIYPEGRKFSYEYNVDWKRIKLLLETKEDGKWNRWIEKFYSHDLYGNITNILTQYYESDTVDGKNRLTRGYDENGNKITELKEYWSNDSWENYSRDKWDYDVEGNKTTELFQHWKNNRWINSTRINYGYNEKNQMIYSYIERWQDDEWINDFRYEYYYPNNSDTIIVRKKWGNGTWINDYRSSLYYNSFGKISYELVEDWENSLWINFSRISYEYNNNGKILVILYEGWEEGEFTNSGRVRYDYDSTGFLISKISEDWINGEWDKDKRCIYEYDKNGNFIYGLSNWWRDGEWKYGHWNWEFSDSAGYYYDFRDVHEIEVFWSKMVTDVEYKLPKITNFPFPNPFTNSTTIEYSLAKPAHVKIDIYNSLGDKIETLVDEIQVPGGYEAVFDGDGLPAGVYYYKMRIGGEVESGRMVIVK